MVSEITKTISPISPVRNYGDDEEGTDNIDIGGGLDEEEKNPFYEEDENEEEFIQ